MEPKEHTTDTKPSLRLQVVNGRERVTPEVAACYQGLAAALTADDWANKVGGVRPVRPEKEELV